MDDIAKEALETTYHPCQPGYKQAGEHYIELNYSADCKLGRYICQAFEVQSPQTDRIHVIPDGCNDIIVAYNGREISGRLSPSIPAPNQFHFDNPQWIFGIRFLPGATYALFRNHLEYHVRQAIDMKLLLADFGEVDRAFRTSRSFIKRLEIMGDFLEKQIRNCHGIEEILQYCVNRFIATNGLISVEELAESTGYSTRYLRQLFAKHVGHSPKELANIIRMQKALRFLWETPAANLSETAQLYGFSDQSHMNREFRRFLGATSGVIREDENWISYLKTENSRIF